MKYLNERITQAIDLGSIQAKGTYQYMIQVRDYNSQYDWTTIFVGNYYNNGTRWYTFDITDLCRSRKFSANHSYENTFDTDVSLVSIYKITVVTDNGGQTVSGQEIQVANIYPYPNAQSYEFGPSNVFFDPTTNANRKAYSVLAQGYSRYRKKFDLLPHYPIMNNVQDYDHPIGPIFGVTIETGVAQTNVALVSCYEGDDPETDYIGRYWLDHLMYNDVTHTYFDYFNNFIYGQGLSGVNWNIDVYLYTNDDDTYVKIATIDACKSRYYLLWQDRYGSYQSQPFKGDAEYSEDINNTEMISYTGKRLKSNVSVQPKWKINSGWLKEKIFPYYESIFVSPVLKLYDTKTQETYDVIVKDNYIEKKYDNNKKLLSLELKLEASEKQNINY